MTTALILGFSLLLFCNGAPVVQQSNFTCTHHLLQIENGYLPTNEDESYFDYSPTCEEDGITWRPEQCHQVYGTCFCVNPNTGVPRSDTQTASSLQELNCNETASNNNPCQRAIERYHQFIDENPGIQDYGFVPICTEEGQFRAMQSDANFFFCVDTMTGEKIPQTFVSPDETTRAINVDICQQYSELWNEFNSLYYEEETHQREEPVEGSCRDGFEYHACGCEKTCIPGSNMSKVQFNCAVCEPVCICPDGFYNYNGSCVSGESCMNMTEEILDPEIKILLWGIFLRSEGAQLLNHTHNVIEQMINGRSSPFSSFSEEPSGEGSTELQEEEEMVSESALENSGEFELYYEEESSTDISRQTYNYVYEGSQDEEFEEEEETTESFEETQTNEENHEETTRSANGHYVQVGEGERASPLVTENLTDRIKAPVDELDVESIENLGEGPSENMYSTFPDVTTPTP